MELQTEYRFLVTNSEQWAAGKLILFQGQGQYILEHEQKVIRGAGVCRTIPYNLGHGAEPVI